MKNSVLLLLFISFGSISIAQEKGTSPLMDFDFWIGSWEVTMSTAPDWKEKRGVDEVSYLLNGRLIEEVFRKEDTGGTNFQRGYLMYLARDKRWKHTIYDAKWGEYTFYGNRVEGKMVLQSDPLDTRPGIRRETFYNISNSGFIYLWESSYDGGMTWKKEWKVVYERIESDESGK